MNLSNYSHKKDKEIEEIISNRISTLSRKLAVVGTGITSSHLGDERNLREFIVANSVVNNLREQGINVNFYLFDDSYDPLDFRQLRVAVKKDEKLIEKYTKYCGTPLKLIPDPYDCHSTYSSHFQNEILNRFHSLDIFPNIIDSYSSYESGLYNFAKEIVLERHEEINDFLKEYFPKYTMKKLFWPLCIKCFKLEGVDIKKINKGQVTVECTNCENRFTDDKKNIRGKFSWKIDAAVKWNVFKVDFEPYSKAYLDPDVGSYFISKKLSEKFFGGYYPEIINYGQLIMDKSMSYKILASFPKEAFHIIFNHNRKTDLILTDSKLMEFSRNFMIDDNLSFYDYIITKLPYDIFEILQGNKVSPEHKKFMEPGVEFAKFFLNRELNPKYPNKDILLTLEKQTLVQIRKLFQWVILFKLENPQISQLKFTEEFRNYLKKNNVRKAELFPIIRRLLHQEESLPMSKIYYYAPLTYLYGCLLSITQGLSELKSVKKDSKIYAEIN